MKNEVLAKEVNHFLENFGKTLDGRPKFRLVYAPEQLEKRTGEFGYSTSGLYIGTTVTTREVPKYTYLSECYVLEELVEGNIPNELHVENNSTYEPLFTFESATGVPLPLSLHVVDIVMYAKLHPRSETQIRTDIETAAEEKKKKLHQLDMDTIDVSVMQTRLHHGESNYTKGVRNI